MPQSISQWIAECHGNAKAKGFWEKDRNVGEMLMLITSELGEAIEAHRHGKFGTGQKDTFEDFKNLDATLSEWINDKAYDSL